MSSPKDFHIDAVYPEPLSRLRRNPGTSEAPSGSYRRAVKKHRGPTGRFRTQPVTFHEIKEVDEDNLIEGDVESGINSKSESDLKAKFEIFYASIIKKNNNGERKLCPPPLSPPEPPERLIEPAPSPPITIPFNPKSRPSL